MSVEIEPAVCPDETFEQPASEKSRGTCDQDALAAQLLPQRLGSREDAVEIVRQSVCCSCVAHGSLTRLYGSLFASAMLRERRRRLLESDGKSPPCNRSSIA